jgi:hypothetical protein
VQCGSREAAGWAARLLLQGAQCLQRLGLLDASERLLLART